MKKIILSTLIAAVFLTPSAAMARNEENRQFRQGQHQERHEFKQARKEENKAFRESLKGLSAEEKQKAVLRHRTLQLEKRNAFHEKIRQENSAFVKDRLAKNPQLTQAQKDDLVKFIDEQQRRISDFRGQQQTESQAFLEKTFNDASLNPQQKKEAIRAYYQQQRTENRSFYKDMRGEWKSYRDALKPAGNTPAAN